MPDVLKHTPFGLGTRAYVRRAGAVVGELTRIERLPGRDGPAYTYRFTPSVDDLRPVASAASVRDAFRIAETSHA